MDGEQDDESVLDLAIQTVVSLLKKQTPTLVHCGAGMSRAPAVAAAALSIVQGGSPDEKLKEIAASRPHDVSPQLWDAVKRASKAD
jgi:protein-tyrosine phosphatase